MFGLLSKEKALERKYRKLSKRLFNMYAQGPDRAWAAQQLAQLATPEAVGILLSRFEKRAPNHTLDKDEKTDIERYLVDMGPPVVEPTIEHLRRSSTTNVNWSIRVLRNFLEPHALADVLAEVIDAEDLEYGRNPERKEQLVLAAGELEGDKLAKALIRMLQDANEPVRYNTADALLRHAYPDAREPLLERLVDEDESRRVTTLILEKLVESEWTVSGHKARIEELLPEGFAITRAGTIRRRG
jgi:HEAT repeat protein